MVRALVLAFLFVCLGFNATRTSALPQPLAPLAEWEQDLVRQACSKSVVLLGENSHGDGATIALKARLVPEFAERCGFRAIAFEANLFDFSELRQITQPEEPFDRMRISAAVGGIWNRYTQFASLADWLSAQTPKTLTLAGIDDQLGAAGSAYAYPAMLKELAGRLPIAEQAGCEAALIRAYTDTSAWDGEINECLGRIESELAASKESRANHLLSMTIAFRRGAERHTLSTENRIAARDKAMADNLLAFRRTLPRGTKIIVWVANAHAAYGGMKEGKSLGECLRSELGSKLYAIGFTSAGGQYRWSSKEVREVPVAAPGSLEAVVLGNADAALATKPVLTKLGVVPGTALAWHRPQNERWSDLFDAIVVLRREEPTTPLPTP